MHCISPRARAGFSMLAASMVPAAAPAPTMVCISSMKRMTLGFFCNSLIMERMRSSNWPRYLVPATTDDMSSMMTRLSNSTRDTFFCVMRRASPSTMADLPTPGSPISTGLFFLRRLRICARRSISRSRPTTGSSLPSAAARVMSVPKLSSTGVSLVGFCVAVLVADGPSPMPREPSEEERGDDISSSSSSSSVKPMPAFGLADFIVSSS